MSDVERNTDKSHSGHARLVLDGKEAGVVHYLFHDNFRSVMLNQSGTLLAGERAELYVKDPPYRLKYAGSSGNWHMLDSFIS